MGLTLAFLGLYLDSNPDCDPGRLLSDREPRLQLPDVDQRRPDMGSGLSVKSVPTKHGFMELIWHNPLFDEHGRARNFDDVPMRLNGHTKYTSNFDIVLW